MRINSIQDTQLYHFCMSHLNITVFTLTFDHHHALNMLS